MLWMNTEGRAAAKAENPDASLGDIGKACGVMWKEMGEEKARWNEKAAADKRRYERELAEYNGGGVKVEEEDDDDEPEAAESSDEDD